MGELELGAAEQGMVGVQLLVWCCSGCLRGSWVRRSCCMGALRVAWDLGAGCGERLPSHVLGRRVVVVGVMSEKLTGERLGLLLAYRSMALVMHGGHVGVRKRPRHNRCKGCLGVPCCLACRAETSACLLCAGKEQKWDPAGKWAWQQTLGPGLRWAASCSDLASGFGPKSGQNLAFKKALIQACIGHKLDS